MKLEDVEIGMKVKIPKTKSYVPTTFKDFLQVVDKKGMIFGVVSRFSPKGDIRLSVGDDTSFGFLACDLEPYEEPKEYPYEYKGEVPLIKDDYKVCGNDVYVKVDTSKNIMFTEEHDLCQITSVQGFNMPPSVGIFNGKPLNLNNGVLIVFPNSWLCVKLPLIKKEVSELTMEEIKEKLGFDFKIVNKSLDK